MIGYCSQCGKDMGHEWMMKPICASCCHRLKAKPVANFMILCQRFTVEINGLYCVFDKKSQAIKFKRLFDKSTKHIA